MSFRPTRRQFVAAAAALSVCAVPTPARAVGLDARDAGLVPGGGDQTRAFQDALDRARRSGQPLILPAGDIAVSRVELGSLDHIIGLPGRSRLVPSGTGPLLMARGATGVRIEGVAFDAPSAGPTDADGLIDLEGVSRLVLRDCDLGRTRGHGARLIASGGEIANNRFRNAEASALFSMDSTGLLIDGNEVTDCYDNGLLVWRSNRGEDGSIIRGNRIARIGAVSGGEGQWGNGINLYRAGSVIVSNNRIEDCEFSAVRINSGPNCQIVGNNCSRLGEVAMYAEFAFDGAVIANNLISQAALGISVTNFNDGGRLAVVSGNMVRDLFTRDHWESRGVGISVEADAILEANVVENAPVLGLNLGWGRYLRNVLARGNLVRNTPIGLSVSVADGAGRAVIRDNLFENTPTGAIIGMDHDDVVTGDLLDASDLPANVDLDGNVETG
ncbi:MAG: TIGR03808 family TAT-translocated repetitive protein [Pseudomonadota bacterium]